MTRVTLDRTTRLGSDVRPRRAQADSLRRSELSGFGGGAPEGNDEYRWEAARVFGVGGSAWGADAGIAARMP